MQMPTKMLVRLNKNVSALTPTQNRIGADAGVEIKIETPPVRVPFVDPSALALDIPVDRSLLLSTPINLA